MEKQIIEYIAWKSSYTHVAGRAYEYPLKTFGRKVNKKIEKLTLEDVIKYSNYIKANYSSAYHAFVITIIRNLITYYHEQNKCNFSPKLLKTPRVIEKRRVVVTDEDFDQLSKIWGEDTFMSLRNKLTIHLLWDTGARVSELTAVRLDDINLQERTLIIPTRKALGERHAMWSEETHRLLIKYLGIRICLNKGQILIISSKYSKPLSEKGVQRIIRQSCKKALILKNITPHSFRHGKAHKMLKQGANVKEIQTVLGHVGPSASFKYLKLDSTEIKDIAKKYV